MSICKYDLTLNSTDNKWENLDVKIFNSSFEGGTCIYENYLYYILGAYTTTSINYYPGIVSRLNLDDVSQGWESIDISGYDFINDARFQFGYYFSDGNFYVVGGKDANEYKNSIINISLSTNTFSYIIKSTKAPTPRSGASFVYSNGCLYMFGGKNQEKYYNELWRYNFSTYSWALEDAKGNYPSPRASHSTDSQGNFMLVMGGEGETGTIFNDFYLINFESSTWTVITPDPSSPLPYPVSDSCAVLDLPNLYFVGGVKPTGLTNSLWKLDISEKMFTKLYETKDMNNTFFGHGCEIVVKNGIKFIYSFFGYVHKDMNGYCSVNEYNLSQSVITPKYINPVVSGFPCRGYLGYGVVNNNIFIAGGQANAIVGFKDIWNISIQDSGYIQSQLDTFEFVSYTSASTFFNNTLYLFSGFSTLGISLDSYASDIFQTIYFGNFFKETKFCGRGMYYNNSACNICPPGYYCTDDALTIIPCPPGTYNNIIGSTELSQCIPCPLGYYASNNASTECIKCSEEYYCFIGSTHQWPFLNYSDSLPKDIQPGLYESNDYDTYILVFTLFFSSIMVIFFIIYFSSPWVRRFLSSYDLFKSSHIDLDRYENSSEEVKEKFKIIKKYAGSFFTGIGAIILDYIITYYVTDYIFNNIQGQISLVPIASLLKQETFYNITIYLNLYFNSYRGNCSSNTLNVTPNKDSHIIITNSQSFYKNQGMDCNFKLEILLTDVISNGDYIDLKFTDFFSYSSEIYLYMQANSSIPNTYSACIQTLYSDDNKFFRGSNPSIFYFNMIPSIYYHQNLLNGFTNKGYYIYEAQNPETGSQYSSENLPLSKDLNIQIQFLLEVSGVVTIVSPSSQILPFLGTLAGSIGGIYGVIGLSMAIIEWCYFRKLIKKKSSKIKDESNSPIGFNQKEFANISTEAINIIPVNEVKTLEEDLDETK